MKKWIYVLAMTLAVLVSLNLGADSASANSSLGGKPITTTSSNPTWE